MEHKNDIGKAVREKLDGLDKAPDDRVWAAIEADLPTKKKRRFLPFWIFLTSAVLVSFLYFATESGHQNAAGQNIQRGIEQPNQDNSDTRGRFDTNANQSGPINNGVVTNQNTGSHDSGKQAIVGSENPDAAPPKLDDVAEKSNRNAKPGKIPGRRTNDSDGNSQPGNKKEGEIHGKHISKNQRNAAPAARRETASLDREKSSPNESRERSPRLDIDNAELADKIAQGETVLTAPESKDSVFTSSEKKKEDLKKKLKDTVQTVQTLQENHKTFGLFLYAAPTYYNRFSKISTLDRRLDSIPGSAAVTFNYGGFLCFDYDAKWSFRFGVAKTKLQYTTKGISVSSLNSTNYYNVEYASGINNQYMAEVFADSQHFDIVQEVSYLEFPIELKYKFLDKKPFSIEAIGGASTLFLKKNTLTAESDSSGSILFGGNKDLSKAYFSLNAGIGLSYRLAENFKINIEPMFKYHIKSHSTAMQGYSIVALAGLEYTFNFNSKKKAVKK